MFIFLQLQHRCVVVQHQGRKCDHSLSVKPHWDCFDAQLISSVTHEQQPDPFWLSCLIFRHVLNSKISAKWELFPYKLTRIINSFSLCKESFWNESVKRIPNPKNYDIQLFFTKNKVTVCVFWKEMMLPVNLSSDNNKCKDHYNGKVS